MNKKLKIFIKHIKIIKKEKKLIFFLIIAFLIGVGSSIFIYNKQKKDLNTNVEVTFINSHQAIIFWTTKDETIGFIKYGVNKKSLKQTAYQTSSSIGNTHVVVLNDIPIEGIYISLHNESDSPFLFTQVKRIVFDASKYIE